MIVKKYHAELKTTWDEFVTNHTCFFFFQRDFIEYHKDRFEDHSLMLYNGDELVAILPASIKGSALVCHGGLTFGFLVSNEVRYSIHKEMWSALFSYFNLQGFFEVVYKKAPQFFTTKGRDNDVYGLLRRGAVICKTELTSYLDFSDYRYSKGRKSSVQKSMKQNLIFHFDSDRWSDFFEILSNVLMLGHGVKPTHTLEEILRLRSYFKKNIILSVVEKDGTIVAGSVLFIFGSVVHTQYLAMTEDGKSLCAMDYLLHSLIETYKPNSKGLSFGISTEDSGRVVNEGLLLQKESYGAKNYLVNTYSCTQFI